MSMNISNIAAERAQVAAILHKKFGIEPEKVLFLNNKKPVEPWLSAEILTAIARQSGEFKSIDENFDQFIPALNQVVHVAQVIDNNDRHYGRSGVATIGEQMPDGEEMDEHGLASSRALNAALSAAGFNPVKMASVVTLELASPGEGGGDEASQRNTDLKRIHTLAVEKGLIKADENGKRNMSGYRSFLLEKYGTETAASFDATRRASLINALSVLTEADEFAGL